MFGLWNVCENVTPPVILVDGIKVCKMFMRMLHTPIIIDKNKVCKMFMRMLILVDGNIIFCKMFVRMLHTNNSICEDKVFKMFMIMLQHNINIIWVRI